jgi:leucine-rich repeat protein SHOC2
MTVQNLIFSRSIGTIFLRNSIRIAIDSWREYNLIKIDASVDLEPIFLLKMTCPSTGHIHVLRVPPTMKSAEATITWINHGIHPDEIAVQT